MKLVVTGGGSGGHTTPLLAVASEIRKLHPDAEIIYIGQRGDRFADMVGAHESISSVRMIFAGKLRRYHGEGLRQLLDFRTVFFNLRDMVFVAIGIVQCIWLLVRLRPDVVFVKGGFVGVPVGLAAALWRIPFVTHDSDAIAGLANRIIARWAKYHAVGQPAEQYAYPRERTITVGVPIAQDYAPVDVAAQAAFKRELGVEPEAPVVLITGGGLGARLVNEAAVQSAPEIFAAYPKARIFHLAGQAHQAAVQDAYAGVLSHEQLVRVTVIGFTTELYRYSGAADVIIARAGATSMAEFAAQAKATIIVPNPVLAGGHQLQNAKVYQEAGAAVVVQERELRAEPAALGAHVRELLGDPAKRASLGGALQAFSHPESAQELATLILGAINEVQTSHV